jgi:putative lipoprotein (rSAM/lipoprotein system)
MKNKYLKYLLALLALLFGFSSTVTAQYGIPPNRYRIKGIVTSESNNKPIKNIKIEVKQNQFVKKSIVTNEKGEFNFKIYENDIGDTLYISAIDTDADTNGTFSKKDTFYMVKSIKELSIFNQTDKDYAKGENKELFVIKMKSEAIKPKEIKK